MKRNIVAAFCSVLSLILSAACSSKGGGGSSFSPLTAIEETIAKSLQTRGFSKTRSESVAAALSSKTSGRLTDARLLKGRIVRRSLLSRRGQLQKSSHLLAVGKVSDSLSNAETIAAEYAASIALLSEELESMGLDSADLPNLVGGCSEGLVDAFAEANFPELNREVVDSPEEFIATVTASGFANLNPADFPDSNVFSATMKEIVKSSISQESSIGVDGSDMEDAVTLLMEQSTLAMDENEAVSDDLLKSYVTTIVGGAALGLSQNDCGITDVGCNSGIGGLTSGVLSGMGDASGNYSDTEMTDVAFGLVRSVVTNLDLGSIYQLFISLGLSREIAVENVAAIRQNILDAVNEVVAQLCFDKGWITNLSDFQASLDSLTDGIAMSLVSTPYMWVEGGAIQQSEWIYISGYADAGTTVQLYSDDHCTTGHELGDSAIADDTGTFWIFQTVTPSGSTNFYAQATSEDLGTSACSGALTFIYGDAASVMGDVDPFETPSAPTVSSINTAQISQGYVTISGTALPYQNVYIYAENDYSDCGYYMGSTWATSSGSFQAKVYPIVGTHDYFANQATIYGLASECSSTKVSYTYAGGTPDIYSTDWFDFYGIVTFKAGGAYSIQAYKDSSCTYDLSDGAYGDTQWGGSGDLFGIVYFDETYKTGPFTLYVKTYDIEGTLMSNCVSVSGP